MKNWFILAAMIGLFSCGNSDKQNAFDAHLTTIKAMRNSKDSAMKADSSSPLAKDNSFVKLNYFEPSADWIINCKTSLVTDTQILVMDTKGYTRNYLVYCKIEGSSPNGNFVLYGFKKPEDNFLFIPFLDSNAGLKKTYAGGRFIECAMPNTKGELQLDFNQAYNPYCHYNHNFNCPVVPEVNKLKIPINAGEMIYNQAKTEEAEKKETL